MLTCLHPQSQGPTSKWEQVYLVPSGRRKPSMLTLGLWEGYAQRMDVAPLQPSQAWRGTVSSQAMDPCLGSTPHSSPRLSLQEVRREGIQAEGPQ